MKSTSCLNEDVRAAAAGVDRCVVQNVLSSRHWRCQAVQFDAIVEKYRWHEMQLICDVALVVKQLCSLFYCLGFRNFPA